MIIAIDGPAGSGKSTVAKRVAAQLGFCYLDTGAMYRAVAVRALDEGIALADEGAVTRLARRDSIEFVPERGSCASKVLIAGTDVTSAIRMPRIDEAVSVVARIPHVREALVDQQRELARIGNVVMEGRDIGTVVFPDAELKVFLTAAPEERARRRAAQQKASGMQVAQSDVRDAIERRDEIDSTREHSPLTSADDAVEIDTTGVSLEEVVDRIVSLAKERQP
ncbi:MAG: (d)CMP kinase [Coriobacteriia bacterium]|nr:(d)CMP kinase [Coriobacteriia bacterium]